jgi:hypothetical protein
MNYSKNIQQLDILCCVDWHSQNQTVVFFFMTLHLLQYIITFFDKPLTQIRPAFCSGRGNFFFSFLISLVTCALTHLAAPVGAPFRTNKTKQKKRNKNKRHFAVDFIRVYARRPNASISVFHRPDCPFQNAKQYCVIYMTVFRGSTLSLIIETYFN